MEILKVFRSEIDSNHSKEAINEILNSEYVIFGGNKYVLNHSLECKCVIQIAESENRTLPDDSYLMKYDFVICAPNSSMIIDLDKFDFYPIDVKRIDTGENISMVFYKTKRN